jgi:hypothetical protein
MAEGQLKSLYRELPWGFPALFIFSSVLVLNRPPEEQSVFKWCPNTL